MAGSMRIYQETRERSGQEYEENIGGSGHAERFY